MNTAVTGITKKRYFHPFDQMVSSLKRILFSASADAETKENERARRAAEAMKEYGNNILRLAYSYMHNMADAEDILQDTIIKYLDKAPVFDSAEHEKAWLLKVCANLARNKLDYNKVRAADELDDRIMGEQREDLSFVWEAVKQLPVKQREVIHLFYYEGYPTKEIAQILKRNESTVRSDLKRARDKLKEILKEVYDFE